MTTNKELSPLRMAVDVECARRGWHFADLIRALQAAGVEAPYPSMNERINRIPPTRATLDLVASGFGMTLESLLEVMTTEAKAALASGRSTIDHIEYTDPGLALVQVWRDEHAA